VKIQEELSSICERSLSETFEKSHYGVFHQPSLISNVDRDHFLGNISQSSRSHSMFSDSIAEDDPDVG
jgi:hypothetical protein